MNRVDEIIDFWFGTPARLDNGEQYGKPRSMWFKLFETLGSDPDSQIAIESARTHYELIKTFGRFPHRNQILGRVSTPAELAFLACADAFHG